MADNFEVTPGTGEKVATDERTIGGITEVNVQRVDEIAANDLATGQVTATTTAATLVAARDTRKSVTIVNHGSVDVYVGKATVTTANGAKIPPGASRTFRTVVLLQCITASGSALVDYEDEFDS